MVHSSGGVEGLIQSSGGGGVVEVADRGWSRVMFLVIVGVQGSEAELSHGVWRSKRSGAVS
jgi:hypothetical protein